MSILSTNKAFWTFMLAGLAMQVITYAITGDSTLSLISGMSGVASAVLCSSRSLSFYAFGFLQLSTYVVLCHEQRLYGEISENIFYFLTMVYGLFHWMRHRDDEKKVVTRKLGRKVGIAVFSTTAIVTAATYRFLSKTDDTQPMVDAITTVPAYTGEILMMLRYADCWYYWLIIDIGSIVMWYNAGNYCMVAQFVFWTLNCAYGLNKWNEAVNK